MFYERKLKTKKTHKHSIRFTNFESGMDTNKDSAILPYTTAKLTYNFKVKNGCLEDGIGFEDLKLPINAFSLNRERTIIVEDHVEFKKVWQYKFYDKVAKAPKHQILLYSSTGKIYWTKLISVDPYMYALVQQVIYPSGVPNALNCRINGDDCMIFSSPIDGMRKYFNDNPVTYIDDGPCIKSMCLHYDRLFAILEGEGDKLIYTTNTDITDWNSVEDEANYIEMKDERGAMNKVVSFNDYIYVFRDFGVAKLSAYGESFGYSVSQLFVSSSKIYGESVCVCGDRILLLARDGIHEFNGSSTKKLDLGIEKLFEGVNNEKCCTLYHNGKYYLACKLNFDDGEAIGSEASLVTHNNNALIELDLSDYSVSITRGVDICSMITVDDSNFCKVIACFNGEYVNRIGQMTHDGKIFGTPLKKVWTSPLSDMGFSCKNKKVKNIQIKTKSDCSVIVSSENESKTINVTASDAPQEIPVNIYGEEIKISFVSENSNETRISCPQINVVVEE